MIELMSATHIRATLGSYAAGEFNQCIIGSPLSIAPTTQPWDDNFRLGGSYATSATSSTLAELGAPAFRFGAFRFDLEFRKFYASLQSKQQRLGVEFESVLFGNLWELYAR